MLGKLKPRGGTTLCCRGADPHPAVPMLLPAASIAVLQALPTLGSRCQVQSCRSQPPRADHITWLCICRTGLRLSKCVQQTRGTAWSRGAAFVFMAISRIVLLPSLKSPHESRAARGEITQSSPQPRVQRSSVTQRRPGRAARRSRCRLGSAEPCRTP